MLYSYSDDVHLLKAVSRPVPKPELDEKYGKDNIRRFIDDGYICVVDPGYDLYRQESYSDPLLRITDSGVRRLQELREIQMHRAYTVVTLVVSVVGLLLQLLDLILK